MRLSKYVLLSILAVIFLGTFITLVYAPEASLGSGYAVTSNWHGTDVPPGAQVIVTAMTTDSSTENVTFLWHKPNGDVTYTDPDVPVYQNGTTYDGKLIYYANSTYYPDIIGDWGVQALFQGPDGKTKESVDYVVATRATSFNVIPEVPVLGTAGASIAMFLGLAFKMKRKPQE